jgi:hypothetical protein
MRGMAEPVTLTLGTLAAGAKDAGEALDKIGLLDALKNKLVGAPEEANRAAPPPPSFRRFWTTGGIVWNC